MKIAILLAFNTQNYGMYSVDLAAFRVFESLGFTTDYYVAHTDGEQAMMKYGQLPLMVLPNAPRLLEYDVIVYWGDFTTNPQYALDDFYFQRRQFTGQESAQLSFEQWSSIFLLAGQELRGRRLFSIGQSFLAIDRLQDRFPVQQLSALYERFELISPRDSQSTKDLLKAFPDLDTSRVAQGVDCAFFLPNAAQRASRENARSSKKVGAFFFRSHITNLSSLQNSITGRGFEVGSVSRWLNIARARTHSHFMDVCSEISDCALVITDTYHFAINAIRLGVTPVVLGVKADFQKTTLGDLKKKILMEDLEASDLYFELATTEMAEDECASIVAHIERLMGSDELHGVHDTFEQRSTAGLQAFKRALLA